MFICVKFNKPGSPVSPCTCTYLTARLLFACVDRTEQAKKRSKTKTGGVHKRRSSSCSPPSGKGPRKLASSITAAAAAANTTDSESERKGSHPPARLLARAGLAAAAPLDVNFTCTCT